MRHNKKEKAIVKSAKTISATKRERKFFRTGMLFASPWLIGFICFTTIPILLAFYYSFTDYNLFTSPTWVGLKNYIDMFQDSYVWLSLRNTLYMVIIGTPAELIVALCLALLLNQKKVFGLPVFRTIFYLPTLVPVVASAMLFMWVLNGNYGLINQILNLFGIDGPYWLNDPKWTKVSLIIMDTWRCGSAMIIFLAALRSVPASLYEAAEMDGAGGLTKFFRITLPYISPTVEFNLLMGMISRFQYFSQAYVFASLTDTAGAVGGGPSNSMLFYCLYLYRQSFLFYKMGYACAMAILLFVIIMLATALMLRISKRMVNYDVE